MLLRTLIMNLEIIRIIGEFFSLWSLLTATFEKLVCRCWPTLAPCVWEEKLGAYWANQSGLVLQLQCWRGRRLFGPAVIGFVVAQYVDQFPQPMPTKAHRPHNDPFPPVKYYNKMLGTMGWRSRNLFSTFANKNSNSEKIRIFSFKFSAKGTWHSLTPFASFFPPILNPIKFSLPDWKCFLALVIDNHCLDSMVHSIASTLRYNRTQMIDQNLP